MNNYELTFLVQDEAEAKDIKTNITAFKGKVIDEKPWGERALTYPIKKATSAKYFTWTIEMDTASVTEFKKKLNFNEKILRYLLLQK